MNLRGNKLLAALSGDAREMLTPHLAPCAFAQGAVLAEAGDPIEYVYFPLSGMVSVVVVMKDGKAIETATLGRDGMFGGMAGFGPYVTKFRAIVQSPITAMRISSAQFGKAVQKSKELQALCINHNEILLIQARITAACNALHKVEERFCRWLLQTREITGSDTITLTQEFLSEMLGVRRTSITDVASRLQGAGIISYSRGVIKIIDLPALQRHACECFQTLREQQVL
ncbi:Crp/Fnr family transcriptional regulator [Afipia sp. TerB]|jgi:CRP-like cAMP-binding protein